MVESSDGSQSSLLEQVARKRREAKSQEKVREMLPEFKVLLGNLISTKVPAPEVTAEGFSREFVSDFQFGHRRKLDTKLTATIPLEGGETSVTISASGYPEAGNVDSAKSLNYEVDVAELDRVLIIEGSEAKVQSKKWKTKPFTSHTPIGVPLPSWPSWSRPAMAEDLQAYQALLENLSREDVTFVGSTPPTWRKPR